MSTDSSTPPTPAQLLATPVQFLKGVGPTRAGLLERMGLHTARDVLFLFPRDYQDLSDEREVDRLEEGKLQSVRGVIEDIDQRNTSSGGTVLGISVRCQNGHLRAIWFNQPFMRERFSFGQKLLLSGKPKYEGLVWQMVHPRVETLDAEEDEPVTKLLPVYPLTEGLLQWQMRKIVRGAIETFVPALEEVFPDEYLATHDLWPLARALPQIHFPDEQESLDRARRRLVYQELFILQLALAVRRQQQHEQRRAAALEATAKIDARIRRLFPFELTAGQENAIAEIAADMTGPMPMNRLLQGDVGSGKTVVAVYAMLLAVAHGYQAALMAPTEVLARQHALTLERMLAASQVRRAAYRRIDPRPACRVAATNRRGRSRSGDRHAGDHPGGRGVRQAGAGGDRRATQVRRASAGNAEAGRNRSALLGDDRHAHPAIGDDDVVRRSRRFHAARQPAGPAEGQYLPGQRRAAGKMVGFLPPQVARGAAGIRDHAAGRGIGSGRVGEPGRDLREVGQRRVGGVPARPAPRPHDPRRKGRGDGGFSRRRNPRRSSQRRSSKSASTCRTRR